MRDVLHTAVSRAYTSPPCGMEGIVRILDGNEESHVVLMCITIVEEREEHFKHFRTYLQRCTHLFSKWGSGIPHHNANGGAMYISLHAIFFASVDSA